MNYSSVYLRTHASLDETVAVIGGRLALEFDREVRDGAVQYAAQDGARRLVLSLNEFEDEFEGYEMELEVDGRNDDERRAYARKLFDELAGLDTYALVLADDEIEEIARFEPKADKSAAE